MNQPPGPPYHPAPPAPMGPPGGYGIGLPPGVDPMTGAGPGGGPGQGSQQEPMAIISLVLGVVAIPLWFCCGLFSLALTVVGLILGFVSLGRFNREPGRYSGKPLAITGLVVNGLFLVINVVMMIFFVGIMGIGMLSGP